MLQNNAAKIYSVDACYGELAWKLRNDPRVVVMERTNILHLESLPEEAEDPESSRRVDLITIDAGWTKLELVLPVVKNFLKPGGQIIALLKPHYEAQQPQLKKGILMAEYIDQVVQRVRDKIHDLGFKILKQMESPILGGAGNKEFFLLIKTP